MAGIGGVVKDVISESVDAGVKNVVKGTAKGAQAVTNAQKGLYQKALNKASANIVDNGGNIIDRAINKNLSETVANLEARSERLSNMAETGIIKKATRETAENVTEDVAEESGKQISKRNINKDALRGTAIGSITGAGIGGITGMATGADEDDMKSMVLMGAVAGGVAGNVGGRINSKFNAKVASDIAQGSANHSVIDGAKGLMNKAGASVQNFVDKGAGSSLDNIGNNIAKKASKSGRLEIAKEIHERTGGTAKEALDFVNDLASNSEALRSMDQSDALVKTMKKANAIGGAAQGAIMGSASGALIGGVAGGIDEDETFIGGALKGGLIGGTIGGIGGGASGYFNNSAKVLSNTTANVNSLLGR
jgi:hypothetical protein